MKGGLGRLSNVFYPRCTSLSLGDTCGVRALSSESLQAETPCILQIATSVS